MRCQGDCGRDSKLFAIPWRGAVAGKWLPLQKQPVPGSFAAQWSHVTEFYQKDVQKGCSPLNAENAEELEEGGNCAELEQGFLLTIRKAA